MCGVGPDFRLAYFGQHLDFAYFVGVCLSIDICLGIPLERGLNAVSLSVETKRPIDHIDCHAGIYAVLRCAFSVRAFFVIGVAVGKFRLSDDIAQPGQCREMCFRTYTLLSLAAMQHFPDRADADCYLALAVRFTGGHIPCDAVLLRPLHPAVNAVKLCWTCFNYLKFMLRQVPRPKIISSEVIRPHLVPLPRRQVRPLPIGGQFLIFPPLLKRLHRGVCRRALHAHHLQEVRIPNDKRRLPLAVKLRIPHPQARYPRLLQRLGGPPVPPHAVG